MMGIGGGTFFCAPVYRSRNPVHRAVRTSAALGVAVAIPGFSGYIWTGWSLPALPELSFGYALLLGALIIAPVSSLFAPVGAKIAHRLPPRALKIGFGIFLLATAVRMVSVVI